MKHTSKNDSSRKGDMAEYYAGTGLWDNGYEVFKNCGCTGLVDLISRDKKGKTILIDVKTSREQTNGDSNLTKTNSRTKQQIEACVKILIFNPKSRKLRFINHTK